MTTFINIMGGVGAFCLIFGLIGTTAIEFKCIPLRIPLFGQQRLAFLHLLTIGGAITCLLCEALFLKYVLCIL